MKLPFLASFIILILVISHLIRKSNRAMEEEQSSFWAKERQANNIRKKSLDDLSYITIPFDTLPCQSHMEQEQIQEYLSTLHTLSERKIVNLTCISNTDLKLTYGTANITALTEYDQNFTVLVTTLQKWAEELYRLQSVEDAKTVLEYAISIDSDVSTTYDLLASIYAADLDFDKITRLIEHAESLNSPSGKIIVRKLRKSHIFPC